MPVETQAAPEQITAFQPSPEVTKRAYELIDAEAGPIPLLHT
jgi:hypothetical protein